MKTERRHELQTNDLAVWLTKFIEKYRSQAGLLIGLASLGLIAWLAMTYMAKSAERASAGAWSSYFQATEMIGESEGQFDVVANNYAETAAGQWARFSAASNLLGQATRLTFSDREEAKAKIKKAKEHFESLINVNDELLRPRAMLGLAQALETAGALGDQAAIGDAAKQFQTITETFPDTAIAQAAEEQLSRLKQNQENDWYAWFATQEPAADPLSQPGMFDDIQSLPSDPNVAIPGVGSLIRPEGSQTANPIDLTAPANSATDDPVIPANDDDIEFLNTDEINDTDETDDTGESDDTADETDTTADDLLDTSEENLDVDNSNDDNDSTNPDAGTDAELDTDATTENDSPAGDN